MKGAPTPPTPIDPTKVAGAQENANFNTAQMQQLMNMMGGSNPFGTLSYNQTGSQTVDGHTVPTYSSDFQLSDWGKQFENPQLEQQGVSDAIYNQATSRLDPQWAQSGNQLADQLKNQGIPLGSAAYNTAMDNESRAKNDAYTSAQNAATTGGVQAAQGQYNEQLGAVGQMLAAMRGAGPQTGVSPTDVTGAYNSYANQLQSQYQNEMQQYQSQMSGLSNLFDAGMMFI